jgi:hypothetical protein
MSMSRILRGAVYHMLLSQSLLLDAHRAPFPQGLPCRERYRQDSPRVRAEVEQPLLWTCSHDRGSFARSVKVSHPRTDTRSRLTMA